MKAEITKTIERLLSHEITKGDAVNILLGLGERRLISEPKALKAKRKALGFTLREVYSKTGVSISTISRIERGYNCDFEGVKSLDDYYTSIGV